MSFFFQKAGKVSRGRVEKRLNTERPPSARKHIPSLHRLGCAACPLDRVEINTPKMGPTLPENTSILFVGEAPGELEDDKGRPFIGPSGKLLRELIPNEIIGNCGFDNVINCRPEGNRTPVWNEIECCRPRRIKVIEQAKPKLIVGLGKVALTMILGSADLEGLRGRFFVVKIGNHTCWFMPTYHPSFILRTAFNKQRPFTSKFGHCLKMDIKRAIESVPYLNEVVISTESEIRSGVYIFNGKEVVTLQATERTTFESRPQGNSAPLGATLFGLLALAKQAPIKAIDIETSTLRPYAKGAAILTVAISFDDINFAFALDHKDAKWPKTDRDRILAELRSILTDDTIKVAHNATFEIEWFVNYFGKEIVRHEVWECTQLQAHFLDERRGAGYGTDVENFRNAYQALDFLVKMYFGCAYKHLFKLDKKNMGQADLTETLIYNGVDTKFTLKLYHIQTKLLKERGLYEGYLIAVPRQPTVALMQHLGMDVNQDTVKKLQAKVGGEIEAIEAEIQNLDVIKTYVKDKGSFNPLGDDAIVVFRDYLKREEIKVKDGKRIRLSVDKHVLEKIDHPLAKLIVALRNKTKMKSTYIDGLELGVGKSIWPDGKLHTNFNTTFTVTARLSSDFPNLQNFPKRQDSWVREQVVAPKGHWIIAADYGQLEACTAAMCSRDAVLVKALWDEYDIHMEWAAKLAKLAPEIVGGDFGLPEVAKKFRSWVKNQLVFPAIFGSQNSSMAAALGVDVSIIDRLMDEFWGEKFVELAQWQKALMKGYYDLGYVEAPSGRRRHYPITRNEAINAPIQSLASDIVVDAMVRLSYQASTEGKWYLHPRLNIHDDITLVVPDDKLEESIETVYRTMLTPMFNCVNVPLSVEISVGKDWFNMTEIGKFRSNKDL
jgi:uracil-DNA glycosylase family 4